MPKAVALKNVRLATAGGFVAVGLCLFGCWTTTAVGPGRLGTCRRYTAGAGTRIAAFADCLTENTCRAAGAGLHPDGVYRAIDGAGTTLDTGVLIGNNRLPVNYFEHLVWTDDGAHAAAVADLGIKSQSYNIF